MEPTFLPLRLLGGRQTLSPSSQAQRVSAGHVVGTKLLKVEFRSSQERPDLECLGSEPKSHRVSAMLHRALPPRLCVRSTGGRLALRDHTAHSTGVTSARVTAARTWRVG